MSNSLKGAERMQHDLSPLGFLDGHICRLINISTALFISSLSIAADTICALSLSPLRLGLAYTSTGVTITIYFLIMYLSST